MSRVGRFWVLFAATTALYLAMTLWSLPRIAADAGGLVPLDLRPGGYSHAEAVAFLTALSPQGRAFYLDVQQKLDTVYPVLLAATIAYAIWLLFPWRRFRRVLPVIALPVVVFELLENAAIADLLRTAPADVTPLMVQIASGWSELKALSTTVGFVVVLVLLVIKVWENYADRRDARRAR